MKENRGFPPGIGWLPLTVALVLVGLFSVAAFVPQFSTKRTVESVAGNGSNPNSTASADVNNPDAANNPNNPNNPANAAGANKAAANNAAAAGGINCAAGHVANGGHTANGVTATQIHIATTEVTTGIGAGFLGQAVSGMEAAINQANRAGDMCGRQIVLDNPINDGWDRSQGQSDIEGFIGGGNVFALVGEPDSEGLSGAIDSGDIDRAGIPVVGTDGMLKDQYHSPWVWPVAASTATNMHIIAKYAHDHLSAKSFGIVFDQSYRFGPEGAAAFAHEMKTLTGTDITGNGCSSGYCGLESQGGGTGGYTTQISAFNSYCKGQSGGKCDLVVFLLEPKPMLDWMTGENGASYWTTMMGGEPLFDYGFGSQCGDSCRHMILWTGYQPDIQPFDGQKPVYTFAQGLQSVCPSCDTHNEFTQGAYLGAELFASAVRQVASSNQPLTRATLQAALNSLTFDSGLTAHPLSYAHGKLANTSMAAFQDNSSGTFNGFVYMPDIGFQDDPAPGQDMG